MQSQKNLTFDKPIKDIFCGNFLWQSFVKFSSGDVEFTHDKTFLDTLYSGKQERRVTGYSRASTRSHIHVPTWERTLFENENGNFEFVRTYVKMARYSYPPAVSSRLVRFEKLGKLSGRPYSSLKWTKGERNKERKRERERRVSERERTSVGEKLARICEFASAIDAGVQCLSTALTGGGWKVIS